MGLMLVLLHLGFWIGAFLFPVAAFLLVRLFMFQHDCGHGSFFPSRWLNDVVGTMLGVLTLTPYTSWRGEHAQHHASAGNLDRRGIGDITTLTLSEYLLLSPLRRLRYRLYRHPAIMFGLGPVWLFMISNRFPPRQPRRQWRDWMSTLGTNVAVAGILAVMILTFGPVAMISGWLPVMIMAATIGVWLFYIQHQFEEAYWEPKSRWNFQEAALRGASFYDLPPLLHWLTGNIGFHHIHHLSSRIPNYRLRECHNANLAFHAFKRLGIFESFQCARLALWDADCQRLVSFTAVQRSVPGSR
jgi:omega-6 fatty acid desaturase (delta-12 desaturase)